ncbi:Nif3-like dinuclear metal center hexameric protein [Salegentibacter sp. HM20]
MKIKEVIKILEDFAPTAYAEDFDNVGLLTGDPETQVSNALISLDCLEAVVEEAIGKNCNLIICFHPIIFSGLKKLTGRDYVERTIIKAIKNDIAIFAIHTALDNHYKGVNDMICEKLGLENRKILIPRKDVIRKLTTFVPTSDAQKVRAALFEAGAGSIGNYDHCSYNLKGEGSFRPNDEANPTIGERGQVHFEEETQIGVTFPVHLESKILQQLFAAHPYEEVAYEITRLENAHQQIGMGMIGELASPANEKDFLQQVKSTFECGCIRHSEFRGKEIKKVAVLGGSGSFAINKAKAAGADVFLTADLKYHDFYKAGKNLLLADIGHYESEQFTKNLLHSYLTKKISNFALILAETNTNPIKYI